MFSRISSLHDRFFGAIEARLDGWFVGLAARFVFAAVLLVYFFNSATLKTADGLAGLFRVTDNAYFQIVPSVVESYGYDATQVPFIPYGLMVHLGTYAEFLLPVLIVAGLFTRVAASGMIVFVIVQSYVDIAFHGADAATIGALFDRLPDGTILDQRLLWVFLLGYLVVYGAGRVSLDHLLASRRQGGPPDTR